MDPIAATTSAISPSSHNFGKACKFLDPTTRRCTIYNGRPSVCREFPARTRCAYYDLLTFERSQQGDDTVVPLVQITFRNGDK